MTTDNQNRWAQYLENASPREIRQMAEYAIDHIDDKEELSTLQIYLVKTIGYLTGKLKK
jgi:hypothetical protein